MMQGRTHIRTSIATAAVFVALTACDPGAEGNGGIDLSTDSPSAIAITPVIDLSGLSKYEWAAQLSIEHIAVNLEEVRLLGEDPRIPAGGLELLNQSQVIAADGRPGASIVLPLPDEFVLGTDAALFVRMAPSIDLDGAAIEVLTRVPVGQGVSDISPNSRQQTSSSTTMQDHEEPTRIVRLIDRKGERLELLLQDKQVVDVMTPLGSVPQLNVALGIPALRWLNRRVLEQIKSSTNVSHGTHDERGRIFEAPQSAQGQYTLRIRESP